MRSHNITSSSDDETNREPKNLSPLETEIEHPTPDHQLMIELQLEIVASNFSGHCGIVGTEGLGHNFERSSNDPNPKLLYVICLDQNFYLIHPAVSHIQDVHKTSTPLPPLAFRSSPITALIHR
jgi:hypothetical protein